jgi:two-component system osmolarity sensor histidine kinase EnvZ
MTIASSPEPLAPRALAGARHAAALAGRGAVVAWRLIRDYVLRPGAAAASRLGRLAGELPGSRRLGAFLYRIAPKGLYGRSLLIIIMPMVILQSVVAFAFMERHWQSVTRRLSAMVTSDIAALIDVYNAYPQDQDSATLSRIARERLSLNVEILPPGPLPAQGPRPFFSVLDSAISRELERQIRRPFWIDTVGRSELIEIRIQLDRAVMRVFATRNHAYASNSHIFIMWMLGTSSVLLIVAILFLRNQIRPIQQLAYASEEFGKGREVANFRPRGAREVRAAANSFLMMKRRIERQIEQRTTMLNGVSHDLRTILTRFRLQVALIGEGPEVDELTRDIDEMGRMLEAYLAFARGDSGEVPAPTDMAAFLEQLKQDAERSGHATTARFTGDPVVVVRPQAFRRCLTNLVSNAGRFADRIAIAGEHAGGYLTITVDDDGPGIPPDKREDVFRPFYRIDDARNQDQAGTGLGLAIARDIATSHGGDITLEDSPMGGLRAVVRVPA